MKLTMAWAVAAGILVLAVSVQAVQYHCGCCELGGKCYDRNNPEKDVGYNTLVDVANNEGTCTDLGGTFSRASGSVHLCVANKCKKVEGQVVDDPHFTGFGHEKYDFMGEVDHVYNLFSEKNVQLNSRMMKLNLPAEDGTYLGETGLLYTGKDNTDKITIAPVKGSVLQVKVNGAPVAPGDGERVDMELASGARLELLSSHDNVVDVVRVVLSSMTLDFVGTGHHLDIVVEKVAAGLCEVHGVLGQTYKGREWRNGEVNEAERKVALATKFEMEVIEHEMKDYEVSSLFATDDKFSTFGKDVKCDTVTIAAAISSRKMLAQSTVGADCAGAFSSASVCDMLRKL